MVRDDLVRMSAWSLMKLRHSLSGIEVFRCQTFVFRLMNRMSTVRAPSSVAMRSAQIPYGCRGADRGRGAQRDAAARAVSRSSASNDCFDRLRPIGPSHLDVGPDQNAMVVRRQQLLQGLQGSDTAGGILLAVTATEADAAVDFVVDHGGKAANKYGESALETPLNAERFIARKRGAVRRLVEQVGRALVSGRGEGLVPGDLGSGHPRAVPAFERERIAALVGDAERLQHTDLPGFTDGCGDHVARFLEFQFE